MLIDGMGATEGPMAIQITSRHGGIVDGRKRRTANGIFCDGSGHGTAEGHAAMADAALPAARRLLGLAAPARDEGPN